MSRDSRPRAVVLGATGTIGRALADALEPGWSVTRTGRRHAQGQELDLDLRDEAAVDDLLDRLDPELVVLAAAVSNVAACEQDPRGSRAVNVEAVRHVARRCGRRRLVFFSTDAVFSDARPSWSEDDPTDPASEYGRQKAEAEALVQDVDDHLIVRTARVYARERGDGKFVDFVLRTLQEGGEIHAPLDTPGNPTLLDDLVRAVVSLIDDEAVGTWHLAGPPIDSLFTTAQTVARSLGVPPERVHAVARDHGSPTPRITAMLATEKATRAGLRFRDLDAGLALLSA